jgi:hypothetical protein
MFKNLCKILASIALIYGVSSMAMTPLSKAQAIAFLMSGNPRLGENSPAGMIDDFVRRNIFDYLHEVRPVTVVNFDEAKLSVRITDDQAHIASYQAQIANAGANAIKIAFYQPTGVDIRFELSASPVMLAPKKRRLASTNTSAFRRSVGIPVSYICVDVMDSEGVHPWYSFTLTPQQIASMATLQITQHCAKCIGFDGDSCVVGSRR